MSGPWIDWAGGDCPVPLNTRVQICLRYEAMAPPELTYEAIDLVWRHSGSFSDITKYSVFDSGKVAQTESVKPSNPKDAIGKSMLLSPDPIARKGTPITSGVLDYFPLAIAEVAVVSKAGNDQHNPGQPLHWSKGKSTDHADCIARHLIDRGSRDTDGMRHSAKLAWRALAALQIELEEEAAATCK